VCNEAAPRRSRFVRDLEESRQSDAGAPRGQVVRPKLDQCNVGALRLGRKVHRQKKLAIRPASLYLEKIVGTGSAVGAESSVLPPQQGRSPWLIPSGLRPSQNDAGTHATVLCCGSRSAAIVSANDAVRGLRPIGVDRADLLRISPQGNLHHHWQCSACGHDWVIVRNSIQSHPRVRAGIRQSKSQPLRFERRRSNACPRPR